jgi:hypothetical protein
MEHRAAQVTVWFCYAVTKWRRKHGANGLTQQAYRQFRGISFPTSAHQIQTQKLKDHSRFCNPLISQYRLVTQPHRFVRTKTIQGKGGLHELRGVEGKPCWVGWGGGGEPESIDLDAAPPQRGGRHRRGGGESSTNPNPPLLSRKTAVIVEEPGRGGMAPRSIPRFPRDRECAPNLLFCPYQYCAWALMGCSPEWASQLLSSLTRDACPSSRC